jgi:hypothetical protein
MNLPSIPLANFLLIRLNPSIGRSQWMARNHHLASAVQVDFFNHQLLICFVIISGNVRNITFAVFILLTNVDKDEKADGIVGLIKVLKIFTSH